MFSQTKLQENIVKYEKTHFKVCKYIFSFNFVHLDYVFY